MNNTLLQVLMILKNHSNHNYLVGGCVRDKLLGKVPHDWDIVTDVQMDIIEQSFTDNGWKVDATGKNFLVMNVSKNGEMFEIANFRKDGCYADGRRPETVEIGTIYEDAERRDFTCNALYYEPFTDIIIDPLNQGIKDIENRILRFVGNPKDRIQEDYLRVARFYRFIGKGFTPDKKSLKACRTYFENMMLHTPAERLRIEIEKMVMGND
ncbi:CCA tRNA nucleotidyltransferase [uncultured Arcobacter sp.]|uniref:CCA tRNA nucleotidyltransferase n=1 Tax=uncultured Arcobacter sp. TaxID=165434 RepID=UPI00261B2446|nr:CCA tRNA nucleotidyltransferase [uncultured Arcobacter sp.]